MVWLLSAMCTPDLRGTQGSFTFFSTRAERPDTEGGCRCPLSRVDGQFEGSLDGPDNDLLEGDWRHRGPCSDYLHMESDGSSAALLR